MLPVKKINDRVSQDPGYVDTYGKTAPSARVTKLVRNSDLERRVVGSANVATTDNEIRMQKADSDLDDVVRNSETYRALGIEMQKCREKCWKWLELAKNDQN